MNKSRMLGRDRFKETEIGMIPEDWEVSKVRDVARVNELSVTKDFREKEIEYIDIASVDNRRLLNVQVLATSEAPSRAKRIVRDNDILISTVRPNLKHFTFIRKVKPNTIASTGFAVISSFGIHPQYLYYYLTTDEFTDFLSRIADAHTSAYPACNPDVIEDADVAFPSDFEEQKTIGGILCSLDDKIALNVEMNKTFESIGQALFKHWFIDFEFPNEKGKPYKSSGGKMIDSELGEIPEGWMAGKLGDICDITMGQSPPGSTYNEAGGGICFYQGITDFGFRFPSKRVFCTAPTRFAEEGDVLLSVRAPVGALNVAEEKCAVGRGVASVRLKGKQNGFLYYLLLATKSGWETFEAEGTVFGAANKTDVNNFKIAIPPKHLIEKFASIVEPMDKAIRNSEKESRTLRGLRDSLLPRLMSGKIRVNFGGVS